MKVARVLVFLVLASDAISPQGQAPSVLALSQSIQLPQASIWGGISYNGENISITTTLFQDRPHLFLRKLDRELRAAGDPVQLTFDSDPQAAKRITDHKHLFLNGFHYVVFSVAGDSDLYIFRTDRNGLRVGTIVPVVENTSDRTNDMMFCSDGERLYVGYFRPTEQSVIHIFDQQLRRTQPPLVTSAQLPHNNLGGMVYHQGRFYMFTGDKAGPNSNLILTIWNRDWTPAQPARRVLIPAPNGGGYYFATGIAFDDLTHRWYIGFHHVSNSDPDGTTHLDIALFDEEFNVIEHLHTVSGFRPHFLLLDDSLYSVYDGGGVFLNRYLVRDRYARTFDGGSRIMFPSVFTGENESTGIALVNSSNITAHLRVTAYDDQGALIASPGIRNPAAISLPAHAQLAQMAWQIFGQSFDSGVGWLQIVSDLSSVTAFQLTSDPLLETMDGTPAIQRPLTYLVFPETRDSELTLVNPAEAGTAEVVLRQFDDAGHENAPAQSVTLRPHQRLSRRQPVTDPAGYVLAHSTMPLAAAGRWVKPGEFEAELTALDANGGGLQVYAPQFVNGAGFRTMVTLINLEEADTAVTLELRDDGGQMLAKSGEIALTPRGRLLTTDNALLGVPPAEPLQGHLKISSSSTRVTGTVCFQDTAGRRFSAMLPLQSEGLQDMWFSQVAEDERYFTGLAVVNPNPLPANLSLSVFSPDGTSLATTTLTVASQGRVSKLLHQLVPALPAISGGYFTLASNEPVFASSVFGTGLLNTLAAVPAQSLNKPPFVGAAAENDYVKVNPDSDFSPPRGGIPSGPGPAPCRTMIAQSRDGLHFERTHKIVCDQGAVPDLVVDKNGTAYLYYTGWAVGSEINKTVVAISSDAGESWTFKKLNLKRNEGESDLVDPDVLILQEGTFRLYTTIAAGAQYARTYYSDGADGIQFVRKGVAFDPGGQALDPSAIKIGDSYHIFAGGIAGNPQSNWHGTSQDGSLYRFDKTMTFRINGYGQMMANGLAVEGGYRFFCFGNDRTGGITSIFTEDGITWTPDVGFRLAMDPDTKLEAGQPTDPAVARLPDGSYLMVYTCRIPR